MLIRGRYISIFNALYIMSCLNPVTVLSPESRFLRKCRKENRSFEYYWLHSNERRNLLYDPYPLIDNPTDYYNEHAWFPRVMSVPCGKCELCMQSKVNDYVIRNYYQYLETKFAKHGSAWFITLTYADDILPHTIPYDPETGAQIPNRLVSCFSKIHVQNFLKRFRKYSGFKLKYFIVSEYGGEFGRPHYHGIFYIEDYAPTDQHKLELLHLIAASWTKINDRKYYRSMPEYNLYDMQRVDVQALNDTKQIRYCCKYVGKQFGCDDFDNLVLDSDCERFHLQSIGLGSRIYDYASRDIWNDGFVMLDGYKYSIPDYYKDKVMKEYYCEYENGSIVYRPSDFKLQYFRFLSERQFEEHKNLAMLNKDYPSPPSFVYDPLILSYLYDYIEKYITHRECVDNFMDKYLSQWNDYLLEVQKYHKREFAAKCEKMKKQREDYFLKKSGRKAK